MKYLNTLNKFSFYQELDPSCIEFLHEHLEPIKVPKGNILFFQGDVCDTILFLTDGEVRLYIQSDDADEITLYHLDVGEQCIVNTASALSSTAAIGSAVTLTEISGYLLDIKYVKQLAHKSDAYQSYLFSLYSLRMGDLVQLVNDIKFKKLDIRILEWLKQHSQTKITTTHEDIANELGSSRVVISKVLKNMERQGLIQLHRGYIQLM
ncbi:Crp/Fnr family transcriptional regulator [Sulfurimonas sp.]